VWTKTATRSSQRSADDASHSNERASFEGHTTLSGSHLELVPDVVRRLRAAGVDAPVVVGGIIPESDMPALIAVESTVYTPKDFEMGRIMSDLSDLAHAHRTR